MCTLQLKNKLKAQQAYARNCDSAILLKRLINDVGHSFGVSSYKPKMMLESDHKLKTIHGSDYASLAEYYNAFLEYRTAAIVSGNLYGTDPLIRYYQSIDIVHP